ncbi:tetraspanin 37 isoform X2 [Epinephelus lanceolatus]|uniref:tetraspanin 37 isoform X2 n=1 Tax=Epinephelus lanceolatus TaxID=310571 RepID=UPI001447A945|nr:tetraspanin 37 isoform X2 [Epinephelus lanceolatus]
MSDQRRKALKTILQLTSQLLWVVGLVVGLNGVYLLIYYRQSSVFFSDSYITLPAILTLTSAAFLLVSGCLGTWLSLRDSTFRQGLLDSEIAPLSGVFQNYTGNVQDPNSLAVDATQEELQCCGVHGYRDWLETSWFNRTGGLWVPHSCCNYTYPSCNGTVDQPWQLNAQGCQVKLETSLQFVLSFIIWVSPVVFLVEVVLFVTVGQLMMDQPLMHYQILGKN